MPNDAMLLRSSGDAATAVGRILSTLRYHVLRIELSGDERCLLIDRFHDAATSISELCDALHACARAKG